MLDNMLIFFKAKLSTRVGVPWIYVDEGVNFKLQRKFINTRERHGVLETQKHEFVMIVVLVIVYQAIWWTSELNKKRYVGDWEGLVWLWNGCEVRQKKEKYEGMWAK